MLDLSTAHLPQDLRDFGTREGTPGIWGDALVNVLEYGFLVWVPDDPTDENTSYDVPGIVVEVQLYARALDCDWIMFDADGPMNPDLDVFEEGDGYRTDCATATGMYDHD